MGIIHRDVTPSNLYLRQRRAGEARRLRHRPLDHARDACGTPRAPCSRESSPTSRPSRSPASRSITARISSPWASCSPRCSSASRSSPEAVSSRCSSPSATAASIPCARRGARSPRASSRSLERRSRATRRRASRPRQRSRRRSSRSTPTPGASKTELAALVRWVHAAPSTDTLQGRARERRQVHTREARRAERPAARARGQLGRRREQPNDRRVHRHRFLRRDGGRRAPRSVDVRAPGRGHRHGTGRARRQGRLHGPRAGAHRGHRGARALPPGAHRDDEPAAGRRLARLRRRRLDDRRFSAVLLRVLEYDETGVLFAEGGTRRRRRAGAEGALLPRRAAPPRRVEQRERAARGVSRATGR